MNSSVRRQLYSSLAIGLAVFALIFGAQRLGWLQRWELDVYDELIRARHDPSVRDGRIAVIEITEKDVSRFGWPLDDERLATLIETISAAKPRAIGLDLYRNLPEPRDGSKLQSLTPVLRETENLIAVFALPDAKGRDIPGPPSVADKPERLAFNDFPLDRNVVRRALLFAEAADGQTKQSFALSLAQLYLDHERVDSPPDGAARPDLFRLGKAMLRKFSPDDGGYVGADALGYQLLLDFKSPNTFTKFSHGDVVDGRVPPDALRDRIVLIATTAESVKDSLETPLDTTCRGIFLHAQIINQLLREALLNDPQVKVWPEWMEAVWCLIWSFSGAVVGILLLRSPIRASVYFVCAFAALAGLSAAMFFHDWWIPTVAPALGYVLSAVSSLGLVFFMERREFRELMQIFSRHVSVKVARSLWGEREKFLDGNRPRSLKLTASVLFLDYVDFSSVAEKMEPVPLLDWMNTGLGRLAGCVEDHDGVIIRYMGDSLMAVFGAPVPRGTESEVAHDARSAVRCAVAMQAEIEVQNQLWAAEGMEGISMRIGIHTGPAVAGCIGSSGRLEFTVTGDTVNTASHLESMKKQEIPALPGRCCRILVGGATHEFLGGFFEGEFVGEEKLKGKEKNIKVFRILGEKDCR